MMMATRNTRRWIAGGILGLCAAVAIWAPDPNRYQRSAVNLHDFFHVPGFAFVLGTLLGGFGELAESSRGRRWRRLLGLSAIALVFGIGVEFVQAMAGGTADPWDVARNGGGIFVAALFAVSYWNSIRTFTRWVLRFAALALLFAFLVPTLVAMTDEARARLQFPVLADFGAPSELARFTWSTWSSGILERVEGKGGVHQSLRLSLSPGKYPGLAFEYFPRDWRGWGQLVFICANPGAEPLPLTIRINDTAHNQEYDDRYNQTFTLAPGANEIRIPLAEVASAPRTRSLDLAHVALVVAFVHDLREPRDLVVQQIRLTP